MTCAVHNQAAFPDSHTPIKARVVLAMFDHACPTGRTCGIPPQAGGRRTGVGWRVGWATLEQTGTSKVAAKWQREEFSVLEWRIEKWSKPL